VKGNLLFKLQKNSFSSLSQNMWLIHINGAPASNTLQQEANQLIAEIGLPLLNQ
jgi:hypothetical protein